ncbi:hypothetical protein AU255_15570 [Methyloprofundus sedimenti]|uniref:Uncharacterized protein n=1 Tax=Methyloprofundus sedimenti TaxID=1420851 RepID=A0A1V8M254_9GAMM|nr:MliC family protein [Methyloprofundus sedimenti]OQK15639.1 hypothetical protein AU255_15570 [Methyloprofundus sedimenti]
MKSSKLNFAVLWLLSVFLTACAQFNESVEYMHLGLVEPVAAKTYVYECSDGYSFTANIGNNQARLFFSGQKQSITLAHAFSMFGAKFNVKQTTLWIEKDVARLEIDSVIHEDCHNNQAKAIWAHAKLNGVDFRALGNQPSWILEIVKGENIIFADFFGKTINKYLFTGAEPVIDQVARKTEFKVTNKDHTILVTIIGTPCQDTMSGESFDFSVTVDLDDKRYIGCGRSLL